LAFKNPPSMTEFPLPSKTCARREHFPRSAGRHEKAPVALGVHPSLRHALPVILEPQATRLPTSRQGGWALGLTTAIALCFLVTPLRAQTATHDVAASSEVRVECPELASEQRSAIEARQLSELLSQGGAVGTLLLVCSADRVSGTWQEGGVAVDSRFLSRNAGEGAVELLHWVASVLLEMRRERQTSTTAAPAVAIAVAPPIAPGPSTEVPPPAEAQAAVPAAPRAESPPPAERPASSAPKPWTFGLAAIYAHFGTELAGALGPRLTVSHVLIPRLHLTAAADLKAGLGSNAGFGVLDTSAALGVTFDAWPFLSVSAAPLIVITTFSAPASATGPTAPVVAGGLIATMRARLPVEPLRPFVELGVQAATPGRQVTLSGDPVLTVPAWQALVALGVELSL
jgi:hypothetical protein